MSLGVPDRGCVRILSHSAMTEGTHSVLEIDLDYSHTPAVLDLSGEHDFHVLLKIRRIHTDLDPRPITLRITDSLFDSRTAFKNRYFKLRKAKKNAKVVSIPDQSGSNGESGNTAVPAVDAPESDLTALPSRAGRKGPMSKRLHYDLVLQLRIAEHLRYVLTPGQMYNLQVAEDDLGIKWWNYGAKEDLPEPLTPTEPAKLAAKQFTGMLNFLAVSSMAKPPSISVSLSLSSPVVRRGQHHPNLRVEVTNGADEPITLKPAGYQIYVSPDTPFPEPFPYRSIVDQSPSWENFCINRLPSGEDCIHPQVKNVLSIRREGWMKRNFLSLMPNEPLVREIPFLENAIGIVNRMGDENGEFSVKLRHVELWWCQGTVDEIFGEEVSIKSLPNPRALPVIPHGENELTFRWET